jgi:hypothetical protein
MKNALFVSACLFAFALVTGPRSAVAEDKGKTPKAAAGAMTLKGDMVCAKCALKESEKCQNVLKVTEGDKETKYYLADNKTAKDNHEPICSGKPVKATVVGTVKEAKGKKVLTASSVQYE